MLIVSTNGLARPIIQRVRFVEIYFEHRIRLGIRFQVQCVIIMVIKITGLRILK